MIKAADCRTVCVVLNPEEIPLDEMISRVFASPEVLCPSNLKRSGIRLFK